MKPITILLLVLLFLFTGCSAMLEREYLSTKPHDEQPVEGAGSDAVSAENYLGLKNAIIKFVEDGTEKGLIHLVNYPGDSDKIADDIRAAISEVSNNDPLGAYATDYIMGDYNQIVSYYEVNISIVFRHTVEEMAQIQRVRTNNDIRELVIEAIDSLESGLLLRTSYFSELDYVEIIKEYYYQNPRLAFGMPELTVNYYPSSGIQRIIELDISYPYDSEQRERYLFALDKAARRIVENFDSEQEELAFSLYRHLTLYTYYDEQMVADAAADESQYGKSLAYTSYGALVERLAADEGCALAYKVLCDLAGIDCQVVTGRKNGEIAAWNLIELYGDYYHVDTAMGILQGIETGFLLSDEDIAESHKWAAEAYPAATGLLSAEDVLPPTPQPVSQIIEEPVPEGSGDIDDFGDEEAFEISEAESALFRTEDADEASDETEPEN